MTAPYGQYPSRVFVVGTRADYISFSFPMGEYHCRFPLGLPPQTLLFEYPMDVMQLMLVRDAIRRASGSDRPELILPYFPYARQDRITQGGEPLSCKVFADLINSLDFDRVVVCDPHSDVVSALVNNIHVVEQWQLALPAVKQVNPTVLVSPDAGAAKKIEKLSKETGIPILHCGKARDTSTGKLSGFWVHSAGQDLTRPLIVDDICDGGGTFIGLAGVLLDAGAGQPSLYTTHGGYTQGLERLLRTFKHVCTTNTLTQGEERERVLHVTNFWDLI